MLFAFEKHGVDEFRAKRGSADGFCQCTRVPGAIRETDVAEQAANRSGLLLHLRSNSFALDHNWTKPDLDQTRIGLDRIGPEADQTARQSACRTRQAGRDRAPLTNEKDLNADMKQNLDHDRRASYGPVRTRS